MRGHLCEELPSDQVTKELLWYIHKNKTAALIEAALMIGAVLAGAPDEAVKKLEQAAEISASHSRFRTIF